MAKIFKINCYLVDPNGDCTTEDIQALLDNTDLAFPKHIEIDERDIGEWDDSLPINRIDSAKSECEKYFGDAAEIVHCKDCKHRRLDPVFASGKYCSLRNVNGGEFCEDDDFCSYGERKEYIK